MKINPSNSFTTPKQSRQEDIFFVGVLLAHFLLAHFLHFFPKIINIHVYLTVALGIFYAIRANGFKVACIGAYITGSEVLWRMADAVFYEIGKYSVSLIFGIFLFSRLSHGLKRPWMPILYFSFLIPAAFLTGIDFQDPVAFGLVRGNLSGPFALMMSTLFFSKIRISRQQLNKVFLIFLYPAMSLAYIAIWKTCTTNNLFFVKASNFITSGGFNPNEASAILGLGTFFIYFYLMSSKTSKFFKLILFSLGIILTSQTVLTFSRGGVYAGGISLLAASFYLIQNRKTRRNFFLMAALIFITSYFLIWPRLVEFTKGVIVERFSQTSLTHRDELIKDELRIWKEHFWLGVGPGRVPKYRNYTVQGAPLMPHTEFSRLLAEHGLAGVFSLLILVMMGFSSFKRARTHVDKALALSAIAWAFAYMCSIAMRTVTPSFMFGLAAVVPLIDTLPVRRPDNAPPPYLVKTKQ